VSQPSISPFCDDIITGTDSPLESGLYVNDQFPDRLVVTWLLQQEFCGFDEGFTCISDNTIQLILFADGRIQFIYGGVTSRDAIVGITPGGVAPILEVDFSQSALSVPVDRQPYSSSLQPRIQWGQLIHLGRGKDLKIHLT
jgi:hypothetical protein